MKRVKAAEAQAAAPAVAKSPTTAKKKSASGAQRQQKFHCELCGVWCDTNTILQVHFNSKKHKKKELINGRKLRQVTMINLTRSVMEQWLDSFTIYLKSPDNPSHFKIIKCNAFMVHKKNIITLRSQNRLTMVRSNGIRLLSIKTLKQSHSQKCLLEPLKNKTIKVN
jgi:hypothetical protein